MSATIISLPRRTNHTDRRATEDAEGSAMSELRRARIRIAQLESNLTQAMRDSLANFNRARDAERRLRDLIDS